MGGAGVGCHVFLRLPLTGCSGFECDGKCPGGLDNLLLGQAAILQHVFVQALKIYPGAALQLIEDLEPFPLQFNWCHEV